MDKHISAVAYIHMGLAILGVVFGGLLMFILFGTSLIANALPATIALNLIAIIIGIFVVFKNMVTIVGAIGLLSRKNWGRIMILVISALDILCIPVGTAIGVYSFWTLLNEESVEIITGKSRWPKQ
ncbi:hypothetical protein EYV94_26795 [Puteibacter caeruleilacunae]|nr:hypothetical protein EYV94_26795 [Puteibacter caeruleilacunae]